jgi:hypothetical protein
VTYKLFKWNPTWFEQADALDRIAPDWETELQKAVVAKPAFVALTMGCKVDMITKAPTVTGLTKAGDAIVRATYNKRWDIINSNILLVPSSYGYGTLSFHYCLLKDATKLAYDLGWELPKPMMKLLAPQIRHEKARAKNDPRSHPKWRKAFEYESEGLDALYELIEQNYFDANGVPIHDPKKLPAKKALVSPRLKGRTLIEADTIITSGKRIGKNTK